jgi:ATP-dependent DNA ligase
MGRACAFSWRIDCGPSAWSAAPIFNLSLTDTLKRLCDQTVRAFENKPSLVAEVKFTEWTSSGEMRHPVYLGLRTDKRAQDVIRERVVPLKKNQLPSG